MSFVYIFVSVLVILLTAIYRAFGRKIYLGSKINGAPALPILGNALSYSFKTPNGIFKELVNTIINYGPDVRIWIGPHLLIYFSNPKSVEALFTSQKLIDKSSEYIPLKPWLGDGLLLSTGKKWHQRRKILTPAFHFKILDQFIEIFDRQGTIFVEKLSKVKADEKVELFPIITLYALDVICETAMGTSVNAQVNSDSVYVKAVERIAHVIHNRMFDLFVQSDLFFRFSKLYKIQEDALKTLHGFTDKVIHERRDELVKKQSSVNTDDGDIGIKRKMAFLDMLLLSTIDGQPLTNLEIREEVDTFMFEGHDTTTSGITFTLYCIAKHPDVQKKCYQEIVDIIGEDQSKPTTLADLNNLQYLEKVIKESMRLYPPVPFIGRLVNEETTINNVTYPADCTLGVSIFNMGRDPKLFPNPLKFSPERFDGQEKIDEKIHTFAYVPFSAGPRNCIGQKFAMLEMKSVVSKVLRNFEISLNADSIEEPEMIAELILKPSSRINFHLKSRVI